MSYEGVIKMEKFHLADNLYYLLSVVISLTSNEQRRTIY